MLMNFNNPFFLCDNNLPIILHSNDATTPSNLILRSQGNAEKIQEQIDKGLIKNIICEAKYFPQFKNVHLTECKDPQAAISYICKKNFPLECKNKIAITGTNGKTSITHFISQILCTLNQNVLLINSNGVFENGILIQKTNNTTPGAYDIHKNLDSFTKKYGENSFFILETTSIAIEQKRIDNLNFDISCFSNFSQDHLDYHNTIEEYLKQKLNLKNYSKKFIVHNSINQNTNEKYGNELQSTTQSETLNIEYNFDNKVYNFSPKILGLFQAKNILSAILCIKHFFEINTFAHFINDLIPPDGRMQQIDNFIIDSSHTPDAIKNAIETVKLITKGNLFVIAGAGGNRDKSKRPQIGIEIAKADYAIITNDNPRNEEPEEIASQIHEGCLNAQIILDRKKAIEYAFNLMKGEDKCLIVGKGCEEYQIFKNNLKEKFSDIDVVKALLNTPY